MFGDIPFITMFLGGLDCCLASIFFSSELLIIFFICALFMSIVSMFDSSDRVIIARLLAVCLVDKVSENHGRHFIFVLAYDAPR